MPKPIRVRQPSGDFIFRVDTLICLMGSGILTFYKPALNPLSNITILILIIPQ